ncbi:hypothetical protein [Brevibacillus massiliensis]|uniref:hypothetical protein n=1 Tax=Brevibacillus massiliensis TaxID=1118054 RepID=UPI0003007ADF|nr:hypothetical protein [Brevibacillus massiliensis]
MFDKVNKPGSFRPYGKPVVNITINGKPVKDWISFQVELNGLGAVDSYEVQLPWEVTDTPSDPLLYSGSSKSADLVFGSAKIRIEAGFEGEGKPELLIEGDMDYPTWNFDANEGEVVTIHGRSYAARAFDFKETLKWQNLTSTAAFKQIAATHGLTPVVPVETKDPVGEYVKDDHANINREVSHWDAALYLAQNDGFTTRVRGIEWFYGPREMLPNYNKDPLPFTWGHNIESGFWIERAPNAARNLIVEVISYIPGGVKKRGSGQKKGQRIVERASFTGSSTGHKYIQRYYYPGITRDEAQRRARNILKELSRQQVYGSFTTDYFPELATDRRIVLYGVGKGLSQVYFVSKIVVTGNRDEGLKAEVTFTNLPLEEGGRFG